MQRKMKSALQSSRQNSKPLLTIMCLSACFIKKQHYGATMLYGHVHNTREWDLVEKWKKEQWAMGIPGRLINVGCMMEYMRYTPRTLTELLDANPMPEIFRVRKDGSAVEVSK